LFFPSYTSNSAAIFALIFLVLRVLRSLCISDPLARFTCTSVIYVFRCSGVTVYAELFEWPFGITWNRGRWHILFNPLGAVATLPANMDGTGCITAKRVPKSYIVGQMHRGVTLRTNHGHPLEILTLSRRCPTFPHSSLIIDNLLGLKYQPGCLINFKHGGQ
jgi:hypothetical protein